MSRYVVVLLQRFTRFILSGSLALGLLVFIQSPIAHAEISYANPGIQFQATNLTSNTMRTENFDTVTARTYSNLDSLTITNFGTFARTGTDTGTLFTISNFNQYGGAGGAGQFMTANDVTLTFTTTQRYVGFWWSAGNTPNNVTVNLVGGDTESFDAGTLSSALGNCAQGANRSAYCDNPNTAVTGRLTNELYAYVHIRNETGFNSVRFSGRGFELDNISISETIPERVSTETTFSSETVRTDCSSINSTVATNNTRACPRTITISTGTASEYNPLLQSQIAGYTYPATVRVTNSDVNSGAGSETRNGNVISLSSNTVGTFTVNFSIRNDATGGTDTSRITVNVEAVTARIPGILYVDPQETSKKLPIPSFTGATNITICTSQVSNSAGGALSSANEIETFRSTNTAGVTRTSGNNLVTYTGTQANVNTQLSTLSVQGVSNAVVTNGSSKFMRIVVTPTSEAVNNQCATGVSQIVELATLGLEKTRLVDVTVN